MLKTAIVFIVDYLIGCMNGGLIYSKIFRHQDIRKYGSGNAGSTNVLRVYGILPALCVFAFDAIKGIIAMYICYRVCGHDTLSMVLAAIGVICGHNWPIFTNFKGGKGIATTFGIALMLDWKVAMCAITLAMVILFITKLMSLGTLVAVLAGAIAVQVIPGESAATRIIVPILFLMTAYQHRGNIERLLNGKENKLDLGGGK